jgi:hypothetical protein
MPTVEQAEAVKYLVPAFARERSGASSQAARPQAGPTGPGPICITGKFNSRPQPVAFPVSLHCGRRASFPREFRSNFLELLLKHRK